MSSSQRAPRGERTARRQVHQRRRRTDDRREPLLPALVNARQAAEQTQGVGHPRAVEHVVNRAPFDQLAGVHHADPIGMSGNDAQVVGDQNESGTGRPASGLQRLQNLRLNCHVERGGRFVRDDHVRVVRHRDCNHDALAHTAGHLVGEVVDPLLRIRDPDKLQQLDRPITRRGLGDVMVREHRLADLESNGIDRVQRRQRILEDHRDPVAADACVFLL